MTTAHNTIDECEESLISDDADYFAYACVRILESIREGDLFMVGYWLALSELYAVELTGDELTRAVEMERVCFELAREFYVANQKNPRWALTRAPDA